MGKLQPPKNLRQTMPRCCESCAHLFFYDGYARCDRPAGPTFDSGDRKFLITVCDRWRSSDTPDPASSELVAMVDATASHWIAWLQADPVAAMAAAKNVIDAMNSSQAAPAVVDDAPGIDRSSELVASQAAPAVVDDAPGIDRSSELVDWPFVAKIMAGRLGYMPIGYQRWPDATDRHHVTCASCGQLAHLRGRRVSLALGDVWIFVGSCDCGIWHYAAGGRASSLAAPHPDRSGDPLD
jgi:hypothetical protein